MCGRTPSPWQLEVLRLAGCIRIHPQGLIGLAGFTYSLHCSSFFWFNQFYIKDPTRQPQKGTTMETIGMLLFYGSRHPPASNIASPPTVFRHPDPTSATRLSFEVSAQGRVSQLCPMSHRRCLQGSCKVTVEPVLQETRDLHLKVSTGP